MPVNRVEFGRNTIPYSEGKRRKLGVTTSLDHAVRPQLGVKEVGMGYGFSKELITEQGQKVLVEMLAPDILTVVYPPEEPGRIIGRTVRKYQGEQINELPLFKPARRREQSIDLIEFRYIDPDGGVRARQGDKVLQPQ